MKSKFVPNNTIELIIDRTQWGSRNIFMVGVRVGKRSLPVGWTILKKKGASNLQEQKEVLEPVLELLKEYKIIVIGDREFHSAKLGEWLKNKQVWFILRRRIQKLEKKNSNFRVGIYGENWANNVKEIEEYAKIIQTR